MLFLQSFLIITFIKAKDEDFIDDLNSLLNTSDLPNLFQTEEKAIILEAMQTAAKQLVNFTCFDSVLHLQPVLIFCL